MLRTKTVRIARPTDKLDEVVRFYTDGLGLQILDRFENHEGFDGVMIGLPGEIYHFEFTHQQGHFVGSAPTQDNLIVFYLPDRSEWERAVIQMNSIGYGTIPSYNPYWDINGATFEDPDGYRVVLQNAEWEI
ncbi:VOC family protein [Chamaesiphon sp. VAR_48_metabat_135_sub]|uniref:VOC family protein n=1 Tax=Chamaesiphon sp. VAR_48_metabat_135_sub TaxID=2964699 RepID=UPI00286A4519|nr:VOC family protein [Chamaesiphon sp. VAR_48_metabat_135_sub]